MTTSTAVATTAMIPRTTYHRYSAALILLASVTGLRRGELFGLKWEDADFEGAEIRIVRSVVDQVEGPPKTLASKRPIPVSSLLLCSW